MLEFVVRADGLADLTAEIGSLGRALAGIDLAPLAPEMARLIDDENARSRLAGKDFRGADLTPVKRPNDPRRGGTGPPLAPRGAGSRVVANHFVRVVAAGPGVLQMQAGWSGIPWLVAHAEGKGRYGGIPERDILGIAPEVDQFLTDMFADFVDRRVAAILGETLG